MGASDKTQMTDKTWMVYVHGTQRVMSVVSIVTKVQSMEGQLIFNVVTGRFASRVPESLDTTRVRFVDEDAIFMQLSPTWRLQELLLANRRRARTHAEGNLTAKRRRARTHAQGRT